MSCDLELFLKHCQCKQRLATPGFPLAEQEGYLAKT